MRSAADITVVHEVTPTDVAAQETLARAQFTYVPDPGPDLWVDHSDDVLAGRAWQDDCDGLGETVVSLCVLAGLPKVNAFRLFVFDVNGAGHFVGCVQCDNQSWWVVGDTWADAPYPAAQMPHKPKDYNRMSEAGPGGGPIWRSGVPWLAGQPLTA